MTGARWGIAASLAWCVPGCGSAPEDRDDASTAMPLTISAGSSSGEACDELVPQG